MKKFSVLLIAGLMLPLLSCQNGGNGAQKSQAGAKGTQQASRETILVTAVSNPDEVFYIAQKNFDPKAILTVLDPTASITATDRDAIAFAIGVRTANALLAAIGGDMKNAEAIAGGIKDAAAKLNISSDRIQALAAQLKTDLGNADPAVKERTVKEDLNGLSAELVSVLKGIKGDYEALLIQLGGWTEGVRLGTKIIQTKPHNAAVDRRASRSKSGGGMVPRPGTGFGQVQPRIAEACLAAAKPR